MPRRSPTLSSTVLRDRLAALDHRLEAVERDSQALLDSLHPSQRVSGANLLHYVALRGESILELQDALHEFGLSSLASSESHIRHQLAAVRARLGDEASHPKERFSLPEARALLQQRTQALFGTLVPGAPHLMVTFERAFLDDADIVERLLRAGMTVARLNCAHDDESTWLALIGLVRAASARTGLSCAIYMDLGGPKLRTVLRGAHGPHRWIEVSEGDRLPFVEADAPLEGDEVAVACQEVGIVGQLRVGDRVLFDDGLIEGVVMSTGAERASLRVSRVSARKPRLRGEKGMNFPDTALALPSLTETDRAHLPFIRAHADMVGYSFLRSADDLAVLRAALEGPGESPHIILKIETREAVRDLPAILLEAMHQPLFGVMIARGDLAVEIGFERLSEIQEEILWLAEAAHAPVIWATQVLETLNKRGIATRAEITDASFAVRAECVLLNKGPHILKVIDTLRDILARSGGHHEKKRYRMRPMSIARHFLEGAVRPLVLCVALLAGGCAPPEAREQSDVVLAGSTSIQPFAERWAESYEAGRVTVQSGGSTAGIKAAMDGTADFGMSSRELHPDEAEGLVQTIVARDGIAVIVHADNRVQALTLAQLRAIYAGHVRNWREVGGEDAPITVITREDGSGTRETFNEIVMGPDARIAREALVTAYSGGLRKMVAEDPDAIGYVTFSQLTPLVHPVSLDGVLPTEETIGTARYRLQRPFLFLTRGAPTGASAAFLEFVLSPRGQQIARDEGLAPVSIQ